SPNVARLHQPRHAVAVRGGDHPDPPVGGGLPPGRRRRTTDGALGMKRLGLLIVAGLIAGACGSSGGGDADLEPLVFMAGFAPQANLPFVGAYVADELGYFSDAGLAVEIRHSAGGGEHLQLLAAGQVDVTTQDAAVLLQRRADPGLPLVSIGLIGQTGQQAFVALADSGIETPADWAGRTVGYKGTPPP